MPDPVTEVHSQDPVESQAGFAAQTEGLAPDAAVSVDPAPGIVHTIADAPSNIDTSEHTPPAGFVSGAGDPMKAAELAAPVDIAVSGAPAEGGSQDNPAVPEAAQPSSEPQAQTETAAPVDPVLPQSGADNAGAVGLSTEGDKPADQAESNTDSSTPEHVVPSSDLIAGAAVGGAAESATQDSGVATGVKSAEASTPAPEPVATPVPEPAPAPIPEVVTPDPSASVNSASVESKWGMPGTTLPNQQGEVTVAPKSMIGVIAEKVKSLIPGGNKSGGASIGSAGTISTSTPTPEPTGNS